MVKQKQENDQLREIQKKQLESLHGTVHVSENDMFGPLFAEKKNISLEKGLIAERKIELIKDQIIGDQYKRQAHMEKSIE